MQQEHAAVRAFLEFLGVKSRAPDLSLLNELFEQHQLKVPFETLTKLIDFEKAHKTGEFLPSIEEYVRRVTTRGGGGTCWSLARGFEWLLSQLGFETHYMIMAPGHVCLRVELDEPYYVDVGYAAPLFRVYPLFESFEVSFSGRELRYDVTDDGIITTQGSGPRKVLNPTPRSFDEFGPLIAEANQWSAESFLTSRSIFTYIDGVPTSLRAGVLKRYLKDGPHERTVSERETLDLIEHRFGMDPQIYLEAQAIYAKWMRHYGLDSADSS